MAVIKKFEPKRVFISNRLLNKLKTIHNWPVTIIEAPTGYGKTTVIKEYFGKSNKNIIWFNIASDDKDLFVNDFCNRIESINKKIANQIRDIGFPKDEKSSMCFVDALFELEFFEETILIFDNYHLIRDSYINGVITDYSIGKNSNLKLVCLTHDIESNITFDMVLKKQINHISKTDFTLNKDEIDEYYKLCGIKLNNSEINLLFEYTEGWISALYLQMLSYVSNNNFEPSLDVDMLINKAIYNHLNRKEKDFLISICVFDSFTYRQAISISDSLLTDDDIENLLNNNEFINYNPKTRRYYIHTMFKMFLKQEFDNEELTFKKSVYKRAGDWYRDNEEYFYAIYFYHLVKDYDSILKLNYSGDCLIKEMNSNNMELFVTIIRSITTEQKKSNLKSYMILLYALFIYNRIDLLKNECKLIKMIIEGMRDVKEDWYEYEGEYEILNALTKFNNLDEMYCSYEKAYNTLGISSKLYNRDSALMQYNPSILSMFHYEEGQLDNELTKLEKMMPLYYKLFDGSSKGAEALMKAEILLSRGEFKDAALLCKKAMYMAESRNQMDIYIAAVYNLAKTAYYESDIQEVNKIYNIVHEKIANQSTKDITVMNDMCESFLKIYLDTPLLVKSWLTEYSQIEEKCNIYNLSFANLIYGKYLIYNERYEDFLAISGEMLKVASVFNSIINKIYLYIYISICNYYVSNFEKSKLLFEEAIELAVKDNICIPFIENYSSLIPIINIYSTEKNTEFVGKIKKLSKKYSRNMNASKKASLSEQSYGLTKRETDVAKLAAKRFSNKEIADDLFIAESTVKSNLKVIYSKLGINSRSQLKNYFDEY